MARAVYRDLKQLGSLAGNNFFLFTLLVVAEGGAFLELILGLLLLFPLSSDPLKKIPADRLALWPLSRGQGIALRVASVWFSPVAWISLGLLFWLGKPAYAATFLGVSVAFQVVASLASAIPSRVPKLNFLHWIPDFGGSMGGLVRKNLRELLTILDPYLGLVLVLSSLVVHLDADARMILSMLVALSMSTYALCLFGLDNAAGFTRYHLLPLRGWQILAAKDIGFLAVLLLLVLPVAPLPGMAAGLMALAVGHYTSIRHHIPQGRWRFTGGASVTDGLLQAFLMFSAGTLVGRTSAWILLVCVALFALSLWHAGRKLNAPEAG